jgi:predicted DNA-binding protein YlxM (UPF0122 family)
MKLTEAKLKSLINQVINESQNNPTQFEEGMVAEALEFCQSIAESVPNPQLIQHIFMEKDSKFIPIYGMTIDHALQRIAERDAYFNQGVKKDLSRTSKRWNQYQMLLIAFPDKLESLSDEMKQEATRQDMSWASAKITITNNETTPGKPLSIDFTISHGFKSRLGSRNVLFETSDFNEIRGDLYGFITQMFSSQEALVQQVIDMA